MDFFQILVVASPVPYPWIFLEILKKGGIFYEYFLFSLTSDPMGARISKRYSSYTSQSRVFKLFLNFFPMVLTKLRMGFLKFFKIEILTNFIHFR